MEILGLLLPLGLIVLTIGIVFGRVRRLDKSLDLPDDQENVLPSLNRNDAVGNG